MSAMPDNVVIAGAGQAGAQVAQSLRQGGFTGPITMIGDEDFLPYERPPLSKDYLAGKREADKLLLRKADFWETRSVAVQMGRRITSVDPATATLTLDDGSVLSYGRLVWATGGRPRPLACPGAELAGIHYVRGIRDIDRLRAALTGGIKRVVIVGGGYIGLEMAAVLRSFGHDVTVLEAQGRLLARVTSPLVSGFFLDLHRSHGVDVRLDATVSALVGHGGHVSGVVLGDGTELAADLVIVGIGIIANVEPLTSAGIARPEGVPVDAFCQSSDPHILAAGDCALFHNAFADRAMRLESVQNAVDQAKCAAATILGAPNPYRAVPWFWSDQYQVKIQSVGLAIGYDRVVLRGQPKAMAFTVAYLKDNRLVAVDCVGTPRDFMQAKPIIASGGQVDADRLADVSVDLKSAVMDGSPAEPDHRPSPVSPQSG